MRTRFVVFGPSGKVLRTGSCPEELVGAQATDPGEVSVEMTTVVEPDFHMIELGEYGPELVPIHTVRAGG